MLTGGFMCSEQNWVSAFLAGRASGVLSLILTMGIPPMGLLKAGSSSLTTQCAPNAFNVSAETLATELEISLRCSEAKLVACLLDCSENELVMVCESVHSEDESTIV
eukprot:Gregarina_sp_Poly_1__4737@NODE_252_length_10633_cov_239_890119_g220_i0_p9_GENE_NODE_252_length_10633_cov_239_890119_g220_i0NODE_252_length_10633_cov_239_890119_g220_i0_p9_ORF_typecomplete_len107_score14_12TRIC/PF05197_13/0_095_NODE_252_length_10633_cov_239_890119_g220_i026082928